MAKKVISSQAMSSVGVPEKDTGSVLKSPEITDLFIKVEKLLMEGEAGKALDLLARAKITSPWVSNALGVCQLRIGNVKVALDIFRGLVLAPGGIHLRSDVPAVFKTNFAVALLKADNLGGCLSALAEVKEEEHPAVKRIKAAIERWKKSLTLWQRLNWYMGGQPNQPVVLDFPPGELE